MKQMLLVLLLGALPLAAAASGDHAGGHAKQEMSHDGQGMSQDMKGMEGMSHGEHEYALGRPGDPAQVVRTIDVSMDDSMRFNPDRISVKAGETVRFFVKNFGKMPHEMVIGSREELQEHAAMMRSMPNMQHSDPGMLRLEPGQRGGIVWHFDKPGAVKFACLVPGHMEAGMTGTIKAQ